MAASGLDDERFAELLLNMSAADRRRLKTGETNAAAASVAVWMAEELRRQSEKLQLTHALSSRMKQEAVALQAAGAELRRQANEARRAAGPHRSRNTR